MGIKKNNSRQNSILIEKLNKIRMNFYNLEIVSGIICDTYNVENYYKFSKKGFAEMENFFKELELKKNHINSKRYVVFEKNNKIFLNFNEIIKNFEKEFNNLTNDFEYVKRFYEKNIKS